MNVLCPECYAFHFCNEQAFNGHFGTCCDGGQVQLPLLSNPPRVLSGLYEGDDAAANEFRANITQYNAALAFTSLGVDELDYSINHYGSRNWVFRIHGNLYHLSGALEPPPGEPPTYAQLYFYDPTVALQL